MNDEGSLSLINPGPYTLLQDLGRKHLQGIGFCQSGALDEHAYLWANKLLLNQASATALEITFGPFSASFSQPATIAITGAAKTLFLNEIELPTWQSISINAGDHIRIVAPRSGLRTYIAITGGFASETQYNSNAMVPREKSGPFGGGPFEKNGVVKYNPQQNTPRATGVRHYNTPPIYIPDYRSTLTLGVIPSHDKKLFSTQQQQKFFNSSYTICTEANRMGYRLSGHAIEAPKDYGYSAGVPFGTIQITPEGQPIVLLKDRQTIGGYPVIGYVIHLDAFSLGQRRPGEKVRFYPVTLEQSQKRLRDFYSFFFDKF